MPMSLARTLRLAVSKFTRRGGKPLCFRAICVGVLGMSRDTLSPVGRLRNLAGWDMARVFSKIVDPDNRPADLRRNRRCCANYGRVGR